MRRGKGLVNPLGRLRFDSLESESDPECGDQISSQHAMCLATGLTQ